LTRRGPSLPSIFLVALVLRALACVVLLPPWAGSDERFHHSLVLDQEERLSWPAFGGAVLRVDVAAEARTWALRDADRELAGGEPNYETQQSPLSYWVSGLVLRALPARTPLASLYLLRGLNALFFVLAAALTARTARALLGSAGWIPLAYLALLPGLGLALCRVSNDALAALLISVAVAATLPGCSPRFRDAGALAAGLSPWAKLYGGACVPGTLFAAARGPRRLLRGALAAVPAALLLALSWFLHGQVFPLQENIREHRNAGLLEVPWAKDVWTLAKTHVFVSGVPSLVFPKIVYAAALLLLAAASLRTLSCWREDGRTLLLLALPLVVFVASLLYHAWRSYSAVREAGGTGGWYLWAMLLPESLWMSWGLARKPWHPRWRTAGLCAFALLTAFGDAILLGLPGDALVVRGREVFGFRIGEWQTAWTRFAASRPAPLAGWTAAVLLASWIAMLWGILRSRGADPGAAPPRAA